MTCQTVSSQTALGVMWKTVSEECNLACDYCYYSRVGGKITRVKRIESHILEKFISEYMKICNGVASFVWQGGEPLLAGLEFFREVVSLQEQYALPNTYIGNSIQTNATLVDDHWAQFFSQYNFLVGVSLDGPRHIHDLRRVTRSGVGSFDRVMHGIDILRKHHVDFNILTVLHEDNVSHPRDLMEFYQEENFNFVQFIPCMDFHAQDVHKAATYRISPKQYGDFLCEAFDFWYNNGEPRMSVRFFDNMLSVYLNQEAELCIHQKSCPTTLVLEQNGDAYPCDFFINKDYKLGNVGEDDLQSVLGNYVYRNFLAKKPQLPKKCLECEFISLCHGGCPRNRQQIDTTELDVDYFCDSYIQIYRYAHERMLQLSKRIKARALRDYLKKGYKEPGRNEPCICGSGMKYKKCCGMVRNEIS